MRNNYKEFIKFQKELKELEKLNYNKVNELLKEFRKRIKEWKKMTKIKINKNVTCRELLDYFGCYAMKVDYSNGEIEIIEVIYWDVSKPLMFGFPRKPFGETLI